MARPSRSSPCPDRPEARRDSSIPDLAVTCVAEPSPRSPWPGRSRARHGRAVPVAGGRRRTERRRRSFSLFSPMGQKVEAALKRRPCPASAPSPASERIPHHPLQLSSERRPAVPRPSIYRPVAPRPASRSWSSGASRTPSAVSSPSRPAALWRPAYWASSARGDAASGTLSSHPASFGGREGVEGRDGGGEAPLRSSHRFPKKMGGGKKVNILGLFVILLRLRSDRWGPNQCHVSKYGALRASMTSDEHHICI
jgi:hypothetical protein